MTTQNINTEGHELVGRSGNYEASMRLLVRITYETPGGRASVFETSVYPRYRQTGGLEFAPTQFAKQQAQLDLEYSRRGVARIIKVEVFKPRHVHEVWLEPVTEEGEQA